MIQQHYKSDEGFGIRLEARLKNAALVGAREKLGLTAKEAAEQIGIRYQSLIQIENLNLYPSKENQRKICDYYRTNDVFLLEEDVFPEELRHVKKTKYRDERRIPISELVSLSSIDRTLLPDIEGGIGEIEFKIDSDNLKAKLESVLAELPYWEERAIRLRYGIDNGTGGIESIRKEYGTNDKEEMSYENIGHQLGFTKKHSKERVRQMIARGQRRIRLKAKHDKALRTLFEHYFPNE